MLGNLDNQALPDKAEAYDELTLPPPILRISEAADNAPAWLLTFDGHWMECVVQDAGGPLWIENATEGIHDGMSGSPILNENGLTIGIVCVSGASARLYFAASHSS